MPKKRRAVEKEVNIQVDRISNTSGTVNVAGGNISMSTTTGLSVEEIRHAFDQAYAKIDAHAGASPAKKEDIKAEMQEVQPAIAEAAQKKEKVDEKFIGQRFRNIARIAPDILDVIVATLVNPLGGVGVALKKIAEKAKDEVKEAS